MILPEALKKSRNAIRDSQIINLYLEQGYSQQVIANRFGISQERVGKILKVNASAIITNIKDYDKVKRLAFINRALDSKTIPEARTKLELVEAKRKEFEGENVTNIITQFLNITPGNLNPSNRLNALQPNK